MLRASASIKLDLPGVELQLALEAITDAALPRNVSGTISLEELNLERGREHPLFLAARERDQARIWTSPLILTA